MYGYIYRTKNKINNNVYIGQHRCESFDEDYYGSGVLLKEELKEYGKENFSIKILTECENEVELNLQERKYIEKYMTKYKKGKCLNIATGGVGGDVTKNFSKEKKQAFIDKMTEINRVRCQDEAFKERMREFNTNRYKDPKEREILREKVTKTWSTKEMKEQQSKRLKNYYKTHKRDASHQNKKCVFELNGERKEFECRNDLKKFLLDEYDYYPDTRTLAKLLKNGAKGIPYEPFHKTGCKEKLNKLKGMIIYKLEDKCND